MLLIIEETYFLMILIYGHIEEILDMVIMNFNFHQNLMTLNDNMIMIIGILIGEEKEDIGKMELGFHLIYLKF